MVSLSQLLSPGALSVVAPGAFAAGYGSFGSFAQIPQIPMMEEASAAPVPAQSVPSVSSGQVFGYDWNGSNFISARGEVVKAEITDLLPGATELLGKWAHVTGQTALDGAFLQPPFDGTLTPRSGGALKTTVTRDRFDQVVAYNAITGLFNYLEARGLDMKQVMGASLPVRAVVNAVDDLNAWMDPARRGGVDLTFGTSKKSRTGEWHLASDKEIVWHELGHLIFHRIIPALTSWHARDGGSIHEGFADATACLYTLDPEASEDFAMAIGGEYGTGHGLRTVANMLQYGAVDREVHSLGRIYGAFWWSAMKAIAPMVGNDNRAAGDLAWMFLLEHGYHYATNRPGPKDFVDAVTLGARTYLEKSERYSEVDFSKVKEALERSATERGMLSSSSAKIGEWVEGTDGMTRLMIHFANKFAFIPKSNSRGNFSGRQFLQQYAVVDDALLKMLGSGLILARPAGDPDRVNAHSKGDVRTDVRINPEISIEPAKALQAVIAEAQRLAQEKREEAESREQNGAIDPHESWSREASRLRYERALANALAGLADPTTLKVEMVMMPEGYQGSPPENIHYRFALPGAEFYVDARTGKAAAKEMPDW